MEGWGWNSEKRVVLSRKTLSLKGIKVEQGFSSRCNHGGDGGVAVIISASRRTDIPAFYGRWLMNRIREGYCLVPNPFNPKQVSHVSLDPHGVEAIVFWTRNPAPLIPLLEEMDDRGFRYLFQFTVMDNPRLIDPHAPLLEGALDTFRELAELIGPAKVVWRYDPIVLTNRTDVSFHTETFERVARELRGHSRRVTISLVHWYNKAKRRFLDLERKGVRLQAVTDHALSCLMKSIAQSAFANGMEIMSCAAEPDLRCHGIQPGKCIDDKTIGSIFGIELQLAKDPCQRKACGCAVSKDIGMYDSCLFGCTYCYATASLERARANFAAHDPRSPSLLGHAGATLMNPIAGVFR